MVVLAILKEDDGVKCSSRTFSLVRQVGVVRTKLKLMGLTKPKVGSFVLCTAANEPGGKKRMCGKQNQDGTMIGYVLGYIKVTDIQRIRIINANYSYNPNAHPTLSIHAIYMYIQPFPL